MTNSSTPKLVFLQVRMAASRNFSNVCMLCECEFAKFWIGIQTDGNHNVTFIPPRVASSGMIWVCFEMSSPEKDSQKASSRLNLWLFLAWCLQWSGPGKCWASLQGRRAPRKGPGSRPKTPHLFLLWPLCWARLVLLTLLWQRESCHIHLRSCPFRPPPCPVMFWNTGKEGRIWRISASSLNCYTIRDKSVKADLLS